MSRSLPISSLLSPPESDLFASFEPPAKKLCTSWHSDGSMTMGTLKQSPAMKRLVAPISPPVSPQKHSEEKEGDKVASDQSSLSDVADPILFPSDTREANFLTADTDRPLFNASDKDVHEEVIQAHVRSHQTSATKTRFSASSTEMPTREEYRLVLSCLSNRSRISTLHKRNPRKYVECVLKSNEEHYHLVKGTRSTNKDTRHFVHDRLRASGKTILKAPLAAVASNQSVAKVANQTLVPRNNRRVVHSPRQPVDSGFLQDDKTMNKRKEDTDFDALPDYSPPLSTLSDVKALRVDWPGNSINLSQDPHRHLLPETELSLASALRLSCATYLCSKRRIFIGRLESIKNGKDFRKTDAQQACKIDVNKASRLWTAYDRAGWFDLGHFNQFLPMNVA